MKRLSRWLRLDRFYQAVLASRQRGMGWVLRWLGKTFRRAGRAVRPRFLPALESLEARVTPTNVHFNAASFSVGENSGPGLATVVLDAASASTITVEYATDTAGATATAGSDYTATSGTLTFAPSETTKTFSISITNDSTDEIDEMFGLTLTNAVNAIIDSPSLAPFTITDDDAAPTIEFSTGSQSGAENAGTITAYLSLSAASGKSIGVTVTPSGTASSAIDYTLSSAGAITIAPGATTLAIGIAIVNDSLDEFDETVILTIDGATNATVGTTSIHTATITDNDAEPTVQFTAGSQTKAESGAMASMTLSLSSVSGKNIVVPYTMSGTAASGTDYTVSSANPVTITAGSTTVLVSLTIVGDPIDENDETAIVTIGTPTNAGIGATAAHTVTITDDDPQPTIDFSSGSFTAGEGDGAGTLTLRLRDATMSLITSGKDITVQYTTADITATAGSDYTGTTGTLTIQPGNSTATLTIPITNDTVDESNETVRITLSAPVNASLGTMPMMFNNTVTLTINDNDPFPDVAFSASTSQVGEADGNATFTVNLAASSAFTTTVKYATSNGTATAGSDYTGTTGTLTFTPGQTSKTFTVAITNDATEEAHETVSVTLSNPSSLTLVTPSVAVLTIIDNDGPSISFVSSSESVAETAGNKTMTVTLSNASAINDITVVYATVPDTATAGNDYTTTSGTLTFTTGQTSKTFTVPILDDALDEDDETLSIVLSSPNHANLVSPSLTVLTITDDDALPTVQLSSATYTQTEGTTATIVANLSVPSGKVITAIYASANGTAIAGSDYTGVSGTLTFAQLDTSKTFTVVLTGDAVNEDDETLSLVLSGQTNATLGSPATATLTIQEDDPPTNSLPGGQSINEDTSLVFSSGNNKLLSISTSTNHLQSPTQTLQVTLTVAHGVMTLNGTSGLTFTTGDGTGDASMVFTGTADSINTALTTLTYLPTANYNGSDTLTLKSKNVSNTLAPLDTDNVTLTVVSVNDPPDAVDDTLTTAEDTPLSISFSTLLSNDTDVDGTPYVVSYSLPTNGTLALTGTGVLYTPAANFNGIDSFTYKINDGAGGFDTATVTISVSSVNDVPVALPDHGYTPVNTPVTLAVLQNDTDADGLGDPRTLTTFTQGANGTVTFSGNEIIYTPSATFTGQDTFTYTVNDSNSATDVGTVTVTVRNGQWATSVSAVGTEWNFSGAHDWYAVQVLGLPDTFAYGDIVTAWAPEPIDGGTDSITVGFSIEAAADGILIRETYGNGFVTQIDLQDSGNTWHNDVWSDTDTSDPDSPADFLITFSLTSYSVKAARVHLSLGTNEDAWDEIDAIRLFGPSMTPGANTAPTASVAPVTLSEDGSASIGITRSDADGHALFLSVNSQPANGYVEIDDNGTPLDLSDDYFIYTPDPDFNGSDSFGYKVSDHFGGTVTGAVSLNVTSVNDTPVLGNSAIDFNAYKDTLATIDVITLSDASDVETATLSLVSISGAPAHGTATVSGGIISYTPTSGYTGLDNITYTVSDGSASVTGTVQLTVYESGYWATSVIGQSSQYDPGDSSGDWGVSQILDAPDTFDYGDFATAWAPEEDDDGEQWITLGFTAATATGVLIRETNGNGFVTKIDLQYVGGSWATSYWTGTDLATRGHATDFAIRFPSTSLQVQAVKIYVNSDFSTDTFEEIDAVRLLTGGSPASMSVSAVAVNVAPVGTDDWGSTNKNVAVTLDVLANDTDPEGDTLTLTSITQGAQGSVSITSNKLLFTPTSGYVGTDSFTYTVEDGHGGSDTLTVNLVVSDGQWATSVINASSSAPAASGPYSSSVMALGPSSTAVYGDTTYAWSPNASSTGTQYITFGIASEDYSTGVLVRQVSGNGFITKIELIDDGDDPHEVFATPGDTDATEAGRVEDFLLTISQTPYLVKGVKITVNTETADGLPVGIGGVKVLTASAPSSPPSAPDADNDSATTAENMPVQIDVLANDTLSSSKRIEIVSAPSHGTAAVDMNGTPEDASDDVITYWGDADFNGSDSFTYRLSDRYGQSSTATVSLTVTEVNSGPSAGTGSAVGATGNPIWLNVLAYAGDADEDDLEIVVAHDGQHGTADIDDNDTPEDPSDDMIVYTPDEGFVGVDAIGYVLSDGDGATSWGTMNVTIYGSGAWATAAGVASSEGDNGWGEAAEVIGVADAFSSGDASQGWSPTDGGQLEFLTVSFTETSAVSGLVIRQTGDGGLVRRVDLIDDGGNTHVIWAATDPTASGVHDFVLDFPAVGYDVVGARIFVDGSAGTPIIDAIKLRTGGSAEELVLSSWSYSDTHQVKTVYNDDSLAETATVYYHGRIVQTTTTEYDGEVVTAVNVADALGRITRTEYDADGRVVSKTLAYGTGDAAETTYAYDEDGNLISLIDPNSNETTWGFENGREVSMTDPLTNTVTKTYDEDGRLASILNRNNVLRTFEYDEDGRLIEEVWYAGASTEDDIVETFTWNYNAQGLLQSATNNAGTYEFEYDDLGRLIHVLEPFDVELTFGYDLWGYRNLVIDSLGGVERSLYDPSGLLLRRTYEDTNAEVRLDYAYTDGGQVATITRYSDLAGTELVAVSTYEYDWDGRLTSMVHTDSEEDSIADYAWEYDAAGQLVSQTDHGVTVDYVYDDQGQLVSEDDGTTETDYTYDLNGNRDDANYEVGDSNQMTTDGVWNYDYDDEGNLIQKTHIANEDYWTYEYDHANHLIEAKHFDDEDALLIEADYVYDAFGNRIEKIVDWDGEGEDPAEVEKYAYDGWNNLKSSSPVGTENWDVWADLDDSAELVTRYLRGDIVDQLFARVASEGDTLWNLTDHLGSVRDVIDNTGAVVDSIVYDGFGRMTESDPEFGGRYKWTSREFDAETGLQFNRARYYDADTGRWISQDPLGFDAGDSNLYRYVANRPTGATDPSGKQVSVDSPGTEIKLSSADLGQYGKIQFFKDVTLKDSKEPRFRIQVTKGAKGKTYHLMQFLRSEVEADFLPIYRNGLFKAENKMLFIRQTNVRFLDTLTLKSPFVDENNTELIKNAKELSFFDAPTAVHNYKSDEKIKTALGAVQIDRIASVGDTFLLINGEVKYQIHWQRVRTRKQDGTWGDATYTAYGNPVNMLPVWAVNNKLFVAFTDRNADLVPFSPRFVMNPIAEATRRDWIKVFLALNPAAELLISGDPTPQAREPD